MNFSLADVCLVVIAASLLLIFLFGPNVAG